VLMPMGMNLKRNTVTASTLQTNDTSLVDSPTPATGGRNRLSFLKRHGPSNSQHEAILAPVVNLNSQNNGSPTATRKPSIQSPSLEMEREKTATAAHAVARARGKSQSSESQRSKENRKSSFLSSVGGSLGRSRGRNGASDKNSHWDDTDNADESAWVTQSDLASLARSRESEDDYRPTTGKSHKASMMSRKASVASQASEGGKSDIGVGTMGSVRKRLSMLKLGKKSSKGNVLTGNVLAGTVEEE
jgi:hypothetical protein